MQIGICRNLFHNALDAVQQCAWLDGLALARNKTQAALITGRKKMEIIVDNYKITIEPLHLLYQFDD